MTSQTPGKALDLLALDTERWAGSPQNKLDDSSRDERSRR